ncbi:MAG: ABC transporter permease [Chloroflexi bacterium]|nr:ABC transporter permease [Chloroflexota bacterium]
MRFLARRLVFYLVALLVAIVLNFLIPRLMVGDPVQLIIARFQGRIEPSAVDAIKATFGFVQGPLHEQFFTYLSNLLQGNFGPSVMNYPVQVSQVLGASIGWTLRLVGTATILSFLIGTLLGIVAAWRRGSFVDGYVLPFLSVLGAFPYFWFALMVVYVFAFNLRWFPMSHASDISLRPDWTSWPYVSSVIEHAVLPLMTILITSVGGWMLGMRNNMIGVLSQDYIVMAQAKGLAERRVMLTYAARNAILPALTGFAMSLGFVIGGALVIEIVFSYPGVGFTLLQAVGARDYPLMQAIFLLITLAVLVANFLADVAYVLLDPRAR